MMSHYDVDHIHASQLKIHALTVSLITLISGGHWAIESVWEFAIMFEGKIIDNCCSCSDQEIVRYRTTISFVDTRCEYFAGQSLTASTEYLSMLESSVFEHDAY